MHFLCFNFLLYKRMLRSLKCATAVVKFTCFAIWLLILGGFSAISPPGCSANKPAQQELLISAAASLTDVLPKIFETLQDSLYGVQLNFNFAGSSILAQQILAGSPADVYLSADPIWMDRLVQAGRVDSAEVVKLLSNELVVAVPAARSQKIGALEELADSAVEYIALGDPDHVPAGRYAKQSLERAGLWPALSGKIVSAQDVRAALAFVETGEADAGIVYATDAKMSKRVRVDFRIPAQWQPEITYVMAPISPVNPQSRRIIRWLTSPTAQRIFEAHGFVFVAPKSQEE